MYLNCSWLKICYWKSKFVSKFCLSDVNLFCWILVFTCMHSSLQNTLCFTVGKVGDHVQCYWILTDAIKKLNVIKDSLYSPWISSQWFHLLFFGDVTHCYFTNWTKRRQVLWPSHNALLPMGYFVQVSCGLLVTKHA